MVLSVTLNGKETKNAELWIGWLFIAENAELWIGWLFIAENAELWIGWLFIAEIPAANKYLYYGQSVECYVNGSVIRME